MSMSSYVNLASPGGRLRPYGNLRRRALKRQLRLIDNARSFRNGTPRSLARFEIDRHTVTEARSRGWAELERMAELLSRAEAAGFDVLITTDKNISQQNLSSYKIAIVVLGKDGGHSSNRT